jgi:hypothetical protein
MKEELQYCESMSPKKWKNDKVLRLFRRTYERKVTRL